MGKSAWRAGAGAVAALLVATACGCTAQPADEGARDASTVTVAMPTASEPAYGFDPLMGWGAGEHVHEPLIQSTLIATNDDLSFRNDLATSYECSEDGMTWTFRIRDDVRFTDGEPLQASDVAFTINGIAEGEGSEADLSMVERAEAPDATTCVIHMRRPNNALVYTLAVMGIVPEHAYGPDYGEHPIGSGRYMLEQWDRGEQLVLRANPDYYGQAPAIERLVVAFMEEDAALAAAQAGTVDVAYTSSRLAGAVPEGYGLLDCETVDSRGVSLPSVAAGSPAKVEEGDMAYLVGNDVTCDVAVRRALSYGVDRERMIDAVLDGYGTAAYSVGDGMPWSSEAMRVPFDREGAMAMLEEAGWVAGADGVRERDGLRCAFDLYYAASDSTRQALAYELSAQCAEMGIEVTPRGAAWEDIYPHQYSDPVLWGWGSNSPVELYELTSSQGWGNYASYASAEVDAALEQAQAAPSIEDSYADYQRAQWDEESGTGVAPEGAATWLWLANVDHLYFVRDGLRVADQKPHPHGHGWSLVNNVDQWSWA